MAELVCCLLTVIVGDDNTHLAPGPMGNGANFSTALDMQLFVDDLLRREHFPKAYYDLLVSPSFVGDGHRRSFGWDMTAAKSTFSDWTPTGFSEHAICHTGWTGGAIAVDPDRHFAGVVLGSSSFELTFAHDRSSPSL